MRQGAALVLAAALIGCGATPLPRQATVGPELEEAAGVRLLALPRPTAGRVWLSLWIDAGARDAQPPQLAAAAVWAVTPPEIEARVLADGVELSRTCASDEDALSECVRSLAAVLGSRRVEPTSLDAALARVRDARQRTANDLGRLADALALRAAFGVGGDPLGQAADDARIERSGVETFLADHFGPRRALIVAVGDVQTEALRRIVEDTFGTVPTAGQDRAQRAPPARGVEVSVASAPALSAATTFDSPGAAMAAARRLVARLGDGTSAEVFPVRGGTALLVRANPARASELVAGVRELHEESTTDAAVPTPEDARALARWHGALWTAGAGEQPGGLGLGAVFDGGRGDSPVDDPDAQTRDRGRQRMEALLSSTPSLDGTLDSEQADLRLDNGTRIRAARLDGTRNVTVTAIFEGGAREETARSHGVTALLAAAAARECRDRAADELGAPAESLGIAIRIHVGSERFGLIVSGPRERWPEVTYLAARCARPTRLDSSVVERARSELSSVAALGSLARAISPGAPGRIVVTPSEPGAASRDELIRWRDRVAVGRRARIGLAGDVPVEAAVRRLARSLARFPEGAAPLEDRWTGPPARLGTGTTSRVAAWIVWSCTATPAASSAVGRFCESAAAAIRAGGALVVMGQHHLVTGGRAVAAVLVEADEATLAQLPSLVPTVSADGPTDAAPALADTPSARALSLALDPPSPSAASASTAFDALRRSSPTFVVLRPAR